MESKEETASNKIRWSSETNWVVAHGSLESSVAVDSYDDPIEEPDSDSTTRRPPLVLKPPLGPDSNPCEIRILFEQKHEISQIYVRSTARTYEVYYDRSPNSGNEYLCTIRCGVAERDDKILLAGFEEGSEDREEFSSGDTCVSSEDDWVKIKEPEDDVKAKNKVHIIQDYYEATAQISDVDPCSALTIRLLSLQDKNAVYVDEVYIFATQVQSNVTENEEALAGSSAQSSLMAMFVPAFLQMSKSSASRVREKSASGELRIDDKVESRLRRPESSGSVSGENQVNEEHTRPEELCKNTTGTHSVLGQTSEAKCTDHSYINNLPVGHLERTLEQLASRASRVEDICLRFEEKLLKPIEKMEARLQQLELQVGKLSDNCDGSNSTHWEQVSEGLCLRFEEKLLKPIENMEARLQQVEVQLEKLFRNSSDCSSMHGKKFSAPAFSCSESYMSSSYNQGTPEIGTEDFPCKNLPDAASDSNLIPNLTVSAPEFSHGEDGEGNEDVEPSENPSNTNQKKTRSVDDALAAALSGFLSTAKTQIEASSDFFHAVVGQEGHSQEFHESYHIEEDSGMEKGRRESLQYTPILSVKAPDFISEETSGEDHLSHATSASEIESVFPKDREDHVDENAPSLITCEESCDGESNKSIHGSESSTEGNFPPVFEDDTKSSALGYEESISEYSEQQHITDNSTKKEAACNSVDTLANSVPEDTSETELVERIDVTNSVNDVSDKAFFSETSLKEDNLNERPSMLDFEFPFSSSNMSEADTKATLLETLLDGMGRFNIDASTANATLQEDINREDDGNFFTIEANNTEDFSTNNNLLLDIEVYDERGSADSGIDSQYVISTSGSSGLSLL